MYFSAPNGVYAIDAVTGQQIWKYETTGTARRGPLYWPAATASARASSPDRDRAGRHRSEDRHARHELR